MRKKSEYEKFDEAVRELLKVPHSEIKAKLEQEKIAKQRKKKKTEKEHERG
jgi:hypothetical protein